MTSETENKSKIQMCSELAGLHAHEITRSPADWLSFLESSAKMYKYPFSNRLLIHAQRPEATACASMELWNTKMGRWIKKGL